METERQKEMKPRQGKTEREKSKRGGKCKGETLEEVCRRYKEERSNRNEKSD